MAKSCGNCTWYDPNFRGGYCDKNHETTSSSKYCDDWK